MSARSRTSIRTCSASATLAKAVLLVSFDLEEVMNISDRIIVFYEGEIVADVRPEEVTVNELGLYMSGSKRKGAVK